MDLRFISRNLYIILLIFQIKSTKLQQLRCPVKSYSLAVLNLMKLISTIKLIYFDYFIRNTFCQWEQIIINNRTPIMLIFKVRIPQLRLILTAIMPFYLFLFLHLLSFWGSKGDLKDELGDQEERYGLWQCFELVQCHMVDQKWNKFQVQLPQILFAEYAHHNQKFYMQKSRRTSNKPKNYAKIPLEIRIRLVELVMNKGWTISSAARKLSIKMSTAKLIVKNYKEKGAFFEKRDDRLARMNAARLQNEANLNFAGLEPVPNNEILAIPQAQGPYQLFPPSNSRSMPYGSLEGGNIGANNKYFFGVYDYSAGLFVCYPSGMLC